MEIVKGHVDIPLQSKNPKWLSENSYKEVKGVTQFGKRKTELDYDCCVGDIISDFTSMYYEAAN